MAIDYNSKTIGEIVAENYRTAEVFKKYNLDFCCGGGKTIDEACSTRNINTEELKDALEDLGNDLNGYKDQITDLPIDEFASYIVSTHHSYVRENIPLIMEFAKKVSRVHGEANPEVIEIANIFQGLAYELTLHMQKEESILFPYIDKIAQSLRSGDPLLLPPFGSLANPIRMMEHEHENAGDALKKIHELSGNYDPPAHACNTYRVLYAKLQEFEEDLQQHIHLENNILFPKAIKLEMEITRQAQNN